MKKDNIIKVLAFHLLLILPWVATSCTHHDGEEKRRSEQAEAWMAESPDSALRVLNGIADAEDRLSERDYMRYLLLRTEAMNKAYIRIDTVDYMPQVLDYYMDEGSTRERARANYIMGSIYRDRGNAPTALVYFKDAVKQIPADCQIADYAFLSRIYAQMALLFQQQRYPQQELPMWKEAQSYALKAQDILMAIHAFSQQSVPFRDMGNMDSALYVSRRTYDAYKEIGRENYAAASLGFLFDYYLKADSIDKAKWAIDEYMSKSGLMNERREITGRNELFYFYLGKYYEKTLRNDSALYYYRKLLKYSDKISNVENAYRGLMSVYHRMGVADSVYKYSELFANANDSANILNSADEISRTNALYNFSESQQLALEKTEEAARLWRTIYAMAMLAIVVFLILYYIIGRSRKKKREELMQVNRKYSDALAMYAKAEDEMELLKQGIELLQSKKAEEVEQLKQVLLSYQENSNQEIWDMEQSLLQHDIVKRIHKHAARATVPSEAEWNDLMGIVQKLLPDFYTALSAQKNKLTEKEMKVCILIRLNFIPTEMAALLGLTKQRITNIRAGINQKLFQKEGSRGLDANIRAL